MAKPFQVSLAPEQLWHEAAIALSEAKLQGRNRAVVRVAEAASLEGAETAEEALLSSERLGAMT